MNKTIDVDVTVALTKYEPSESFDAEYDSFKDTKEYKGTLAQIENGWEIIYYTEANEVRTTVRIYADSASVNFESTTNYLMYFKAGQITKTMQLLGDIYTEFDVETTNIESDVCMDGGKFSVEFVLYDISSGDSKMKLEMSISPDLSIIMS